MSEFIYVSAVEGHLVPRFPTVGSGAMLFIGAERNGKVIKWNLEAIVRIPRAEWLKFRREYTRAVDSKSLRIRTEAEHDAWQVARNEPAQPSAADESATEGDTQ